MNSFKLIASQANLVNQYKNIRSKYITIITSDCQKIWCVGLNNSYILWIKKKYIEMNSVKLIASQANLVNQYKNIRSKYITIITSDCQKIWCVGLNNSYIL